MADDRIEEDIRLQELRKHVDYPRSHKDINRELDVEGNVVGVTT
jgi:hypothetical protein